MDDEAFAAWAAARQRPRGSRLDRSPRSWLAYLRRRYWRPVRKPLFERLMWMMGRYQAGQDQARDVRLASLFVPVPDLDPRLEGFSILHLGDLHHGTLEGVSEAAAAAVAGVEVDLCLLSGDYAAFCAQRPEPVLEGLRAILAGVTARHGVYLSLGNYDSPRLAHAIRREPDWQLLINRTASLQHDGVPIIVTGLDDPYHQPHAPMRDALHQVPPGYRIVLAHTPDLAEVAAAAGHDLYLCGHTHGGQICWPGGRPLLVNTKRPDLARGLWREKRMWGYTTSGVGVSGIPRRHNCPPEVALLHLIGIRRAI